MSALSERLVKQLLRLRDRELELETKQHELDSKVYKEEELRKELELQKEKAARALSVQCALEKMNDESEARYKAVREQDAEQRKQISDDLKGRIAEADEVSRDLAQREQRVNARKELLLKQQEIYDSHSSSGKEHFDELVAKRELEMAKLAEKKEENIRRVPELQAQLAAETKELAKAKGEQEALKVKVDAYLARFGEIQSQLSAAKKVYEAASYSKDRNLRVLKTLEGELELLRRRAATSKASRDKEQVKVTALEEKVEATRAQIIKFDKVTKMLEGTEETTA